MTGRIRNQEGLDFKNGCKSRRIGNQKGLKIRKKWKSGKRKGNQTGMEIKKDRK